MGSCQSAQASLEQRCGRQMRRNRKEGRIGSSSSSSSSNSSSSLSVPNRFDKSKKPIITGSNTASAGGELQQQLEKSSRALASDREQVQLQLREDVKVGSENDQVLRQQQNQRNISDLDHRISANTSGSKQENDQDNKATTNKDIATCSEEGHKYGGVKLEEGKNERQETERQREGKKEEEKRSKLDLLKGK